MRQCSKLDDDRIKNNVNARLELSFEAVKSWLPEADSATEVTCQGKRAAPRFSTFVLVLLVLMWLSSLVCAVLCMAVIVFTALDVATCVGSLDAKAPTSITVTSPRCSSILETVVPEMISHTCTEREVVSSTKRPWNNNRLTMAWHRSSGGRMEDTGTGGGGRCCSLGSWRPSNRSRHSFRRC